MCTEHVIPPRMALLSISVIRRVRRCQRGNKNRKSKEDRQHNGQNIIDKRTNNDLQNTTPKTKDWANTNSTKNLTEPKLNMNPTKYPIDPNLYIIPTKSLIEPKLNMNPTKNLIDPKLYIMPTKSLIQLKLYMNPTKNLIELKLYSRNLEGSIYGRTSLRLLILYRSVNKHCSHRQFLFLVGQFLKNIFLWNCLTKWTETW